MAMLPPWFPSLFSAVLLATLPAQDAPRSARVDSPAGPAPAAETQRPPPAAITIASFDFDKAIEHYPFAVEEGKRIEAMRVRFNVEMDGLEEAIESIRAEMSLLKRGSRDFEEKEVNLRSAVRLREDVGTLRQRQFDRELATFQVTIFEDMDFVVAQVAKERGIDLVLRTVEKDDEPTPQSDEPEAEVMAKLSQYRRRTVWFASEKVDLTPHLVKYLQVYDVSAERQKAAKAAETGPGKGVAPAGGDGRE